MLTEKIKVQLSPLWVPDSSTYVLCPPKPTLLHIYLCNKEKGRSVGRTEIGWLKRPRELPPSLKAEGRGWRAKCKWEQPIQRRQGPWCVRQTDTQGEGWRIRPESGTPLGAPETTGGSWDMSSWQGGPWMVVSREWIGTDRCASEGSRCCWRKLLRAEAHTHRWRDLRSTLEAEASGVTVELDGGGKMEEMP